MLADHLLNTVKEFKNLKKQIILKTYIKTKLDKTCFAHDAAYSDINDLAKRTISDKIFKDRDQKC